MWQNHIYMPKPILNIEYEKENSFYWNIINQTIKTIIILLFSLRYKYNNCSRKDRKTKRIRRKTAAWNTSSEAIKKKKTVPNAITIKCKKEQEKEQKINETRKSINCFDIVHIIHKYQVNFINVVYAIIQFYIKIMRQYCHGNKHICNYYTDSKPCRIHSKWIQLYTFIIIRKVSTMVNRYIHLLLSPSGRFSF